MSTKSSLSYTLTARGHTPSEYFAPPTGASQLTRRHSSLLGKFIDANTCVRAKSLRANYFLPGRKHLPGSGHPDRGGALSTSQTCCLCCFLPRFHRTSKVEVASSNCLQIPSPYAHIITLSFQSGITGIRCIWTKLTLSI